MAQRSGISDDPAIRIPVVHRRSETAIWSGLGPKTWHQSCLASEAGSEISGRPPRNVAPTSNQG